MCAGNRVVANPGWHKLRRTLVWFSVANSHGGHASVRLLRAARLEALVSRTVELLTTVPVLAVLAAGMLAFVRRHRTLTVDSIFATVAAYLLLALLFTQLYLCLITWDPASFSLPVDSSGRPAHQLQADLTYFSLVTLATVGYGDVLQATHAARMLAMFQAVVGVFYIAAVVAVFVGKYSSQRQEDGFDRS